LDGKKQSHKRQLFQAIPETSKGKNGLKFWKQGPIPPESACP